MRAALTLSAASAAVTLLAGCGGIAAPDLFIVSRSGSTPHARLTLVVNEEGGVGCNGRTSEPKLSDGQIVKARAIQEELKESASAHTSLKAYPGSVLSYRLRDQDGTVNFADNSHRQTKVMRELALFVLQTAQQVCRLPE